MSNAIALSGGGAKGSFQVGALQFIYKRHLPKLGVTQPDAIAGTSVGAINSAKLAEGGSDVIDELTSIWESLNNDRDMWDWESWLGNFPKELKQAISDIAAYTMADARGLFRGTVASLALAAVPGPQLALGLAGGGILWNYIGLQGELSDLSDRLEELKRGLNREKAVLNLNPILAKMNDLRNFDPTKVSGSGIKLRLATVSLDTGSTSYLMEDGTLLFPQTGTKIPGVPIIDGVMASSSIPSIFPPVQIGNELFVDGGIREHVPCNALIPLLFKGRQDTVWVILTSPPLQVIEFDDASRLSNGENRAGVPDIAERALLDILFDELTESNMAPLKARRDDRVRPRTDDQPGYGMSYYVIRPNVLVHSTMTIDPALIDINIAHGYMIAADIIASPTLVDDDNQYENTTKGIEIIELRMRIVDLERRLLPQVREYLQAKRIITRTPNIPNLPGEDNDRDFSELRAKMIRIGQDIVSLIEELRQKKRELNVLIARRKNLGGEIPVGYEIWYEDFERSDATLVSLRNMPEISLWGPFDEIVPAANQPPPV